MGTRIGRGIGGLLGGFVHNTIGRIFGQGEYKERLGQELGTDPEEISEGGEPEVNSLVTPVSTNSIPMMHSDVEGTTRIVRREFVVHLDIKTTNTLYEFKINPGQATCFPWLHNIAKSFQQWSVLGLAAEYVPLSGFAVGSESAALGQVIMAFMYDVNYAAGAGVWPAGDEQALLNYNGSVSMSPAAAGVAYMECSPAMENQHTRFVETEQAIPPVGSLQNYQAARLIVSTGGSQNATGVVCGQLWLTYEILLYQPRAVQVFPAEHKLFSEYLAKFKTCHALARCNGPYSPDEYLARGVELRKMTEFLNTSEVTSAYEIALAVSEKRESDSCPQVLLDWIHATPTYRLLQDNRIVEPEFALGVDVPPTPRDTPKFDFQLVQN